MEQKEIMRIIWEEKNKQGFIRPELEKKAGVVASSVLAVLNGKLKSMQIVGVIRLLDALGLQLVVEEKDIDWGMDMARLRRMPRSLYVGERIEARDYIKEEGFAGRVDLFETVDNALKFIPTPCDIYEIRPGKLIRKSFDVVDHPFGTMYSYSDDIPAEFIVTKVTFQ